MERSDLTRCFKPIREIRIDRYVERAASYGYFSQIPGRQLANSEHVARARQRLVEFYAVCMLRASALGRKQPLKTVEFEHSERPLSGKADIQNLASPESVLNGRFTLESGHSGNIAVNDR